MTRVIQSSVVPSELSAESLDQVPSLNNLASICVTSPIKLSVFMHFLEGYPLDIAQFLFNGFSHGFRIGFSSLSSPSGSIRNNLSATLNKDSVSAAILKEIQRGHTAGPFEYPPLSNLHCSPLGAVPKKDGSTRIILDLSSPLGSSVNDGIPIESCHVKYATFDSAVSMVHAFGKGCFMAKIDIKHAFRLCPVHPDDWHYLGYFWLGRWYFDIRLPFGSRSSPFIFNTFADCLQWILVERFSITGITHYLDDFFLVASSREECQYKIDLVCFVFKLLGIPIAEDKLEGPTQSIVYLGIQIDSLRSIICLPTDKLVELKFLVSTWISKKKSTKQALLSLIGSLSFACKVVKPGRIFLRRLIDLSTTVSKLRHHIDISAGVRADLRMWAQFLNLWNGRSFMLDPPLSSDSIDLYSDASFSGLGAYFQGQWISYAWPVDVSKFHISILELFAVFAAVSTWGDSLSRKQITVFTDNEAIVSVWSTGSSRDPAIMTLVRSLFFLSVKCNLALTFQHVPGVFNVYADLLSRLQVDAFKSACQQASPTPSIIPASVWAVLEEI